MYYSGCNTWMAIECVNIPLFPVCVCSDSIDRSSTTYRIPLIVDSLCRYSSLLCTNVMADYSLSKALSLAIHFPLVAANN